MTLELLSKKNIAILGLSKSGISTIKFLKKKGFNPIGWDDNAEIRQKAKNKGIRIENLKKINIMENIHIIIGSGKIIWIKSKMAGLAFVNIENFGV